MISFVIPVWNQYALLLQCLESLFFQTGTDGVAGMEVVLVDNGSRGEEKALLLGKPDWLSRVRLIELPENTGFSHAVNLGIQAASGELIVLLNSDVVLTPSFTYAVLSAMTTHPEWLHAATRMRQFHQRHLLDDAGNLLLPTGRAIKLGYGEPDVGQYGGQYGGEGAADCDAEISAVAHDDGRTIAAHGDGKTVAANDDGKTVAANDDGKTVAANDDGKTVADAYDESTPPFFVFSACGGAAVYRKTFFGKVGWFDEDFFAYLEDVDLGFRAQRMGLVCGWIPEAVSHHIGSASTGSMKNTFTVRLQARNQLSMLVKNLPGTLWALLGVPIVATMTAQWVRYAMQRNGNGAAWCRGFWEGVRMVPTMRAKRRVAKAGWTQPTGALLQQMRTAGHLYRRSRRNRMHVSHP